MNVAANLVCRTGQCSMASCSCCAPGFDGTTCRSHWGLARARPAGVVWTHGRRRASGPALHAVLLDKLRKSGQLAVSYTAVDASFVRAAGGAKSWAKPNGSRATRFEAPHPGVSRACGLSRGYFLKAFHQTTGLPPHRWLITQRVKRMSMHIAEGRITGWYCRVLRLGIVDA